MKQTIKSILAFAALMLCGGAWADVGDVISININQESSMAPTTAQNTLLGSIPADKWVVIGQPGNGTKQVESNRIFNPDKQTDVSCANNFTVKVYSDGGGNWANLGSSTVSAMDQYKYLGEWGSNRDKSCTPGDFELRNVPFAQYDVYIYFQGTKSIADADNRGYPTVPAEGGTKPTSFDPFRIHNQANYIDGAFYKADVNGLPVDTGLRGTGNISKNDHGNLITVESLWGERETKTPTLGTNVAKIPNCSGDLKVSYWARGMGPAAIQVVEVEPKHVGDVVTWSNTGTANAISASDAKIGESQLNFKLSALPGLPVGSVVQIKKITFASPHTSFVDYEKKNSDGYAIKLNGVQSDWVNGASQASAAALSADKKIQSNSETSDFALEYTFSSLCRIAVGQNYAGGTGSGAGQGVAFLYSNSNVDYGDSTDYATCRYVKTSDTDSVCSVTQTTVESGYYPVYEVTAEVIYVPSDTAVPVSFDVDVADKPTTAKTAYATADVTAFANNTDFDQTIGGKASTVTSLCGASGDFVVIAGVPLNGGSPSKDIWLSMDDGSCNALIGAGNSAYPSSSQIGLTGNVYLQLGGTATVNYIHGGFYQEYRSPTLTGNIDIVVKDDAVINRGIVGAGMAYHNATAKYVGDINITVKNVQSTNTQGSIKDTSMTTEGYIVGGGAYGWNGTSKEWVTGNTSILIDIPAGKSGNFAKNIVGGSYIPNDSRNSGYSNPTMPVDGNSSVTIKAPDTVNFTGTIVAGGYKLHSGSGSATVGGNATITVKGGSFGSAASFKTGDASGTKSLIFDADESVAPNRQISVSAAQIDSGLAVTVKSGTTLNLSVAASGNYTGTITVESGATLNLVSEEGVVHDLPATITGLGNVTKSGAGWISLSGVNTYTGTTVVKAGMIKAMTKNAFGTGHVSIANDAAQDAAIVVLAYDDASTFTLDSAATIVLTAAQIAGAFPLNTGVRSAADLQHTINNDSQQTLENLSFTLEDGIVVINTSSIPVHWDAEAGCWKDDQGNTVSEITGNYTIVLNDSDSVSIPDGCGTSNVTLPVSGRVSIANIGNFPANTVIYIPEATTLALVSHTKTSNVKFDGPGAIELSLDSSNATSNLSNNWLDNTNYVDSFSGRIVLIQGRFETAEILAARVAVEVRDGAQLSTGGTGEWNNHFIVRGDGCEYERGLHNTSEAALRLNNDLGSSAVLEFKQEDEDPKPVIGSHNHSATISAALKGTCGFKAVANENVTYTFKYNSASDLTGAVEFTNKVTPKLDFAGMSVGQQINLGTSFNVPASKTLNLTGYTGSVVTTSTTDKPGVASTINLENGSSIYSDDGSFYLAGIGVVAGATANVGHKWAKGWVYGKLTVPADATLNFNLNTNSDGRDAMLAVKGGGNDCTGTINFNLSGGKKLSITTANNLNKAKAINLNGNGQTFAFQEFPAFNGATVTVNNGAILDLNGKDSGTSGFCTVKLNGGTLKNTVAGADTSTLINKTWPATTWTLLANSSIGGTQAFGFVNYSHNATTLNLDAFTLTKNDANHVVLCNTTINGTGRLLVNAGTMSVRSNNSSSASDATVEVNTDATFDIVNNTEFSVKNLVGNGGQFTTTNTQNGHYKVTGTLSGSGTFGRVTFADGATIDATSGTRTFSATPTFAGAIKVKGASGSTVLTLGDDVAAPTLPTNVKLVDAAGNETAISLEVVGSEVKIASFGAMAGGQTYETIEAALAAVASTKGTVVPTDSSAEVPADYTDAYVKTTVGSTTIIRAKDALIDWKSTNNGDWGAFNDASHAYLTQDGYDTTYLSGDTVCFLGDLQVYTKTATYGAMIQVGKDAEHTGFLRLTCSGEDCTGYILSGSQVTVCTGSTLKAQRHSGANDDGWNSYGLHNGSKIIGSTIEGSGTFLVGKDAKAVIEGETKIATKVGFVTEGATADQGIEVASTGELTLETTTDSGDISVAGVISGSGKVKKTGSADLTLSGANTFTGGIDIAAGTVKAGAAGSLGPGLIDVAPGATLDFNGKVYASSGDDVGYQVRSAGTIKNGSGTQLYANVRLIKSLTLSGDTTASGVFFGMGACTGSEETRSSINLDGHELTIALNANNNFNLQNTDITGNGTIKINSGRLLTYGHDSTNDGTVIVNGGELIVDANTTCNVKNLTVVSGTVTANGTIAVSGTLSIEGANQNRTIARLTMGDGATIKLSDQHRVEATTAFAIGDHLNIDCSAVTDTSFDAINVPAAFHTEANYAKIKAWIGSEYKVGNLSHPNSNWLRVTFGTAPQTKLTEVVTSDGETTIENVVLPMAITESGKTNQTAANGEMKVWEAYVLGLDYTSETAKPVVSSTQTAEAGSIKLVDNLTPKTDAGVNVTRKLFVGTAPGSMSEVQEASYDNGFTVDVPARDDKVKYLKIKYDFVAPQAQ